MSGLIKSIFKEERLNSLLITAVFLFFTGWWIVTFFILHNDNQQANLAWSGNYQIIAVLGCYLGVMAIRAVKNNDAFLSLPMKFFTLGILFQVLGQTADVLYITVLKTALPVVSFTDFFFLSSATLYTCGLAVLVYRLFLGKKRWQIYVVGFVVFVLLCLMEIIFLSHFGYSYTWSIRTIINWAYNVVENIFVALALSSFLLSRGYHHIKFRRGLILILCALILQFFADFFWSFSWQIGTWQVGNFDDYLYFASYAVMCFGFVQFTSLFVAADVLVILLDTFFLNQFILSDSFDRFITNGIVLFVCFIISLLLWRRNKNEVVQKEKLARFEAMAESNRQLQELDKQKTEFLTIAAHHLRTPVSIMRNYLAMIQDGDYGAVNPELAPVLTNMDTSNQWLVRLADEFVAIASLEQGVTKYHISPTNLTELIAQIVRELTPRAKEQRLVIRFDAPAEPFTLPLDAEKIRQAFMNLLDNAIKYSESGTITVAIRAEDNGIAVRVVDQGIGFAPADLQNFFQKFRRGNNAKALHVNTSTGLGLYIARMFVEGHGGRVWAKSEGVNRGSEFGFWIPAQR